MKEMSMNEDYECEEIYKHKWRRWMWWNLYIENERRKLRVTRYVIFKSGPLELKYFNGSYLMWRTHTKS